MDEWYKELERACKDHKSNCDECEYSEYCHSDDDEDGD